MKALKAIFAALLALAMVFSFASCSDGDDDSDGTTSNGSNTANANGDSNNDGNGENNDGNGDEDNTDEAEEYRVIIADDIAHGKITASRLYGTSVLLTATPDEGYELDTITVTTDSEWDDEVVPMTGFSFEMPIAGNAFVSATFIEPEIVSCTAEELADAIKGLKKLGKITVTGGTLENNSLNSAAEDALYASEYGVILDLSKASLNSWSNSKSAPSFSKYEKLYGITLPDDCTNIEKKAFYGCPSLRSVTIPEGVTSIGESAFAACDSLTSITIPNSVTEIGDHAFGVCQSLSSLTILDSTVTIGYIAFTSCKALTSVSLGNGITKIGREAFYSCYSLPSIVIPDSVTEIGFQAFTACFSLTSVKLGNGLTSIGTWLFSYCESLESVEIPASMESISGGAFRYCRSLSSVTFKNTEHWYSNYNDYKEAIDVSDAQTNAENLRSIDDKKQGDWAYRNLIREES